MNEEHQTIGPRWMTAALQNHSAYDLLSCRAQPLPCSQQLKNFSVCPANIQRKREAEHSTVNAKQQNIGLSGLTATNCYLAYMFVEGSSIFFTLQLFVVTLHPNVTIREKKLWF